MTEQPIAEFQKIRLAVDEGANGEKLPATRGHFSEKYYKSIAAALKLTPGLIEHIAAMTTTTGQQVGARVSGGGDAAPLPMNAAAFSDVNETYRRLVYFATFFAGKLGRQAPGPAKRAWRGRIHQQDIGTIAGLPNNITPSDVRYMVGIMAKWLELNLEDLMGTNDIDAIEFFHDDFARDMFRLNARWPRVPKPRYSEMPCPEAGCGGRIAIWPPQYFAADERIVCETCGFHIMPYRYEAYVKHYNTIQTEADPVKKHLMKKWLKLAG